jgi:hypothetical protein
MTPFLCRLGLHKWENVGELVLLTWKEPGFVPGTTEKIRKYVHTERKCSRCSIAQKRILADNPDGTQAAIGWAPLNNQQGNSDPNSHVETNTS